MKNMITRSIAYTLLAFVFMAAVVFTVFPHVDTTTGVFGVTAGIALAEDGGGGDGGGDGGGGDGSGGGGDGGGGDGCGGCGGDTGGDAGGDTGGDTPLPPPPPPALVPVCTLSAAPSTLPIGGGNTTLTWTTENVTSVSIDQGVGSVALDGSQSVAVTSSKVFTLFGTGPHGNVTCAAPVTVPVAAPFSCDSFTVSPGTITTPQDVTLTWTTTGADSVSINNGVGAVAEDGSTLRPITVDTTFILTVTKGAETKTCSASVDLNPVTPGLSCDSFTASPSSFGVGGGNTTLTWATTGATSVSINEGIGSVAADGSQTVSVSSSKTFILTASNGASSVTCQAPVSVDTDNGGGGGGGGGGSSAPRCDFLKASDTRISAGDSVTLSWKTRRGTRLEINPDVLDTKEDRKIDSGSIVVKPTRDTKYTLTVYKGSRKDTCTVAVNMGGVSVISDRDQTPLTSISFREIPYTGFEAGPFLTSVFYTLLALWSMAIAYVLVVKRESVFGFSLAQRQALAYGSGSVIPHDTYRESAPVVESATTMTEAPMNLPFATQGYENIWNGMAVASEEKETDETEAPLEDLMSTLENDAHAHNILLSSDAMRLVIDHAGSAEAASLLLQNVIERAKASFAREDGWIVLNRERVMALFPSASAVETPIVATPVAVGAHTLAEAIVTGNTTRAYEAIGHDPIGAVADAAEALDAVVRARRSASVSAPDMLVRASAHIADQKIKEAVTALVSAIDGTYADEEAAVRLAVIKALKAVA